MHWPRAILAFLIGYTLMVAANAQLPLTHAGKGAIGGGGGGSVTVTFRAQGTSNVTGGSANINLNCAASGAERVIVIGAIAGDNTTDLTLGTVDGQTPTSVTTLVTGTSGNGAFARVRIYRVNGTGTAAITAPITSVNGDAFGWYAACWQLSGGNAVTATGTSTTINPTLNLNTAAGGAVVAAGLGYDGTAPITAAWTGVTEDFDGVGAFSTDMFTGASASNVGAATPRSVSAAYTGFNNPLSFAAASVSFAP